MTPLKMLHVNGSSVFGGDSVLILELGRAAMERGFEVDVLATDPRFQEEIRRCGLGLVDLDVIRREIRPLWDLRGLVRLTRFLSESSYSIVHTHTSKPGIVGRLAGTRVGIPVILHTHHLFPFHEETGKAVTAAYVGCERLAGRWCDRIVTVSNFHRDWALRLGIGSAEQVIAIPNGVPTERTQPTRDRAEVRAELGFADSFVVLFTGRLAEQKGLRYLIRAAAILRPEMPELRVVLAGAGPLENELLRLVSELGLEDAVTLTGFRSDVGDLLSAADLVALPSLWEGLSISLLEAMAAGKPVVTTTLGSNREVTNDGETALLVPPKDHVSLASAIRALARDEPRRDLLARRGREVQRERYTLSRMTQTYLDEYDRLLEQKSRQTTQALLQMEGA